LDDVYSISHPSNNLTAFGEQKDKTKAITILQQLYAFWLNFKEQAQDSGFFFLYMTRAETKKGKKKMTT